MVIGFDASRAFVEKRTGTENYSYQLLKALLKIDRKNKYRIYVNPYRLSPEYSENSVSQNNQRVRNSDKSDNLKRRIAEALSFSEFSENWEVKPIAWPRLWTQGGLAIECLINPPDVLFIPAHTLPIIRRPGLKTVVTIHDLGAEYLAQYHQFPQKYYLNWSTVYAVRNATRIIAVSQSTKKDLISKLQCDIEVIRVIYEGVNALTINNSQLTINKKEILRKYDIRKPYMLFVGTIQPRKNIARLIEAFAKIRIYPNYYSESIRIKKNSGSFGQNIRMNSNLQLVIVGKPGWLYDEIYQAPKKFGIEDKVRFLDFVEEDELAILYKEASLFCLPSLYEGFGLPVLEAMAAGTPALVSNTSSLPEVVGDAGLLVDPQNSDDIAQGIQKVLTDKKLREELVKKGRERVKKFTWEKTAREILEVIEEASSNSK